MSSKRAPRGSSSCALQHATAGRARSICDPSLLQASTRVESQPFDNIKSESPCNRPAARWKVEAHFAIVYAQLAKIYQGLNKKN
eukprot:4574460-Pleurochrysis_carterae.AAC.4